jgi:NADPH2 dehydrogenase
VLNTDAKATYVSEKSGGTPGAPGLYTPDHVTKWKRITDRVHAKGGKVVVQLWAAGWTNDGKSGVPVVSAGDKPMAEGKPVPHALTEEEIQEYIDDYTQSAKYAIEAGFDGIELHGAREWILPYGS